MKKIIYLVMLMLTVCFGFFGVVNAEETEPSGEQSNPSGEELGELEVNPTGTDETEIPKDNEPKEEESQKEEKEEKTDNEKEDTKEIDDEDDDLYIEQESEEKTIENPSTGIEDYMMLIVPIVLIAGTAVVLKKRNI